MTTITLTHRLILRLDHDDAIGKTPVTQIRGQLEGDAATEMYAQMTVREAYHMGFDGWVAVETPRTIAIQWGRILARWQEES